MACNDAGNLVVLSFYGLLPILYKYNGSVWKTTTLSNGHLTTVGNGDSRCYMTPNGKIIALSWYGKGNYYNIADANDDSTSWVSLGALATNNFVMGTKVIHFQLIHIII